MGVPENLRLREREDSDFFSCPNLHFKETDRKQIQNKSTDTQSQSPVFVQYGLLHPTIH